MILIDLLLQKDIWNTIMIETAERGELKEKGYFPFIYSFICQKNAYSNFSSNSTKLYSNYFQEIHHNSNRMCLFFFLLC